MAVMVTLTGRGHESGRLHAGRRPQDTAVL